MEEDFVKQIENRLAELPENVQQAILSNEWEQKVLEIGKANNLHFDQIEKLGDETLLVMLGFTEPSAFSSNIEKGVLISKEVAEKIVGDVNTKILIPIREAIKNDGAASTIPNTQKVTVTASPTTPTPPKLSVTSPPPAATPAPTPPAPQNSAPKPPMPPMKAPDLHPAQLMMNQKTVQVAPPTPPKAPTPAAGNAPAAPATPNVQKPVPPKPQNYQADPYREPIE